MATTTTSVVTHVRSFYDKDLLERALPFLLHTLFGQQRDIPQHNSQTIKFRRYNSLAVATTALTEGTTPSSTSLSVTDVSATVAQYGAYVELTDVLETTTEDPIILEVNELLGEQAGNTFDQLARDVMVTGTGVQYASTATSRSSVSSAMKLTADEVREAVRTLKNNKAKRITSMVNASTGVDTTPVSSAYVGIVHPNTTYDLKDESGWTPVEKYSSTTSLLPNEVGKIDEVRFVETTNAKVFTGAGASSIDVYATLILGQNAYGVTRVSGKALETITKPLGKGEDPLNQRATHGWKGYFVAKILNDDFMLRIEHAVSS